MQNPKQPWSVPFTVEDIPDTGGHYEISADAATREAVAKLAGLRGLSRLEAVFDVVRTGGGLAVTGRVSARAGQTCVVTLEPIENDVDEAVELVFAPPEPDTEDAANGRRAKRKGDPPEPLMGDSIDLGAIATEFLILGLDPYPRKPGVEFAPPAVEDPGAHPFAALEALKKPAGGNLK